MCICVSVYSYAYANTLIASLTHMCVSIHKPIHMHIRTHMHKHVQRGREGEGYWSYLSVLFLFLYPSRCLFSVTGPCVFLSIGWGSARGRLVFGLCADSCVGRHVWVLNVWGFFLRHCQHDKRIPHGSGQTFANTVFAMAVSRGRAWHTLVPGDSNIAPTFCLWPAITHVGLLCLFRAAKVEPLAKTTTCSWCVN